MKNKLDERVGIIILDAQRKTDDELENESKKYNYIQATEIHYQGNIFRKAVAFIRGERFEFEEHQTNVANANSLSVENKTLKNDEARINTARNLFRSALAHFNEAKHKIEHHWNYVINSNALSTELGYKDLLDVSIVELKTCHIIGVELKKIQEEYNELQKDYNDNMKKQEYIEVHNKTLTNSRKPQGGKNE